MKYPTKRMNKELFNQKVKEGKIMIGGLGNLEGVYITYITKNRIWYK